MDMFLSILPLIFIFFIFYLIVIRPQSKAEAKRKEFIRNLKKGDIVYLSSGIIGKVIDVGTKTISLEVSKDVKIRVLKDAVQGPYTDGGAESRPKESNQSKKK